jgi:hypothetical protein
MATLHFYQEPVALDRKVHQSLRMGKPLNLDFAKDLNSVPVAGIEFFEASRELPVLFTKNSEGEFIPMVLLSLQPKGHNIGDNWSGIYMPAFIRQYPFALAQGKVIFDKQAPQLQEKEGEALFNENGENTDFLNKLIEFLGNTEGHFKITRDYCQACASNDFFTPFKAQVKVGEARPMRLGNLFMIDQSKLNSLPDEQIKDWFRKGWLAWSYAHLHSLGAIPRLIKRERQAGAEQESRPAKA